ncbi:unnamed protein product, partial [Ixodes pacificus]
HYRALSGYSFLFTARINHKAPLISFLTHSRYRFWKLCFPPSNISNRRQQYGRIGATAVCVHPPPLRSCRDAWDLFF